MRLKKLTSTGFSHLMIALGVVVVIGVAGTYLLVSSHADSLPPDIGPPPTLAANDPTPPPLVPTFKADVAQSSDGSLRSNILINLVSQLGEGEHPPGSNCTMYNNFDHAKVKPKYYQSCQWWCVYFVSWVWQHAGVKDSRGKNFPTLINANEVENWGKQNGRWHSRSGYGPHTGDIVIFAQGSHAAIVASSVNSKVTIIGGNYGDHVAFQVSKNHTRQDYARNFYVAESKNNRTIKEYVTGFVSPD